MVFYYKEKAMKKKGALFPELGTFQSAAADGGNSNPVWDTFQ